jgi:diguanylate cyclase (GGDEF)-like protein/PAS domain S-box-containing protein
MFELITPLSYWILTALWLVILVLYIAKLRHSKAAEKTVTVLLVILAIDAFRTVFESAYFGLYFNSLFGLLPKIFHDVLSQPGLLVIPKILNIVAGLLVLFLLIRHWVPRQIREREEWIKSLKDAKTLAEVKQDEAEQQFLKFKSIFDGIPDAIVYADTDRKIISTNIGMEKTFGYTNRDLVGKSTTVLYESQGEFDRQGSIRFNLSAEEKAEPYEINYRHKNGQVFVGETVGTPVHGPNGSIVGYVGVIRNVSDRKQAEEKLKLAASVFTHALEGIMITDASGTIIEVNDTFSLITGYSREEALGENPRILNSDRQDADFYESFWTQLLKKNNWSGEIWNRRKNGELYAQLMTVSAVCDENDKVLYYVSLFNDISLIKHNEQQLEHIAHFDLLTGLPNRVLLADRLEQAMKQSQRRKQSIAVAFLDLDNFKIINDTHGHEVGDELLLLLSQRMKDSLREGDTLARFGGDEFVAVLVDFENLSDCEPLLERLLQAAANPVIVGDFKLKVSVSIGVTLYPQDGADADQLMRHADQAMYIAKQGGKNRYHVFDVTQDAAIKNQRESVGYIKQALERNEFVLHYQPKVNMQTGDVIGAEALIRWQHPELGLLPPGEFLPYIENHPISVSIGEWVIDTALTQMSQWHTDGLDIPVSVNVGARQLQGAGFVTKLSDLLGQHPDVQPCCLELEILETSALDDTNEVSTIMNECIDIGVRFALDDFGTGFSSLTYLKRLPAVLLKVDQSFVRDMLDDPDDRAIVNGVISLAAAFNRLVIAEGVETVAHGSQLLSMGCVLAQGYGIARPMPGEDMPAWAANWKPDPSWTV